MTTDSQSQLSLATEGGSIRSKLIVNDKGLYLGPSSNDDDAFIEKCERGNSLWIYHFIPNEDIHMVRYFDKGDKVWVTYSGPGGLPLLTTLSFELSSNAAMVAEDLGFRNGFEKSTKPRPFWKKLFPHGVYTFLIASVTIFFYAEYLEQGAGFLQDVNRPRHAFLVGVIKFLGETTNGWGILIIGLSWAFYHAVKFYKLVSNRLTEYTFNRTT